MQLPIRQYKKMEWVNLRVENGINTIVMRDAWAQRLVELGMVVCLQTIEPHKGLYKVTPDGLSVCRKIAAKRAP